MPIGHRAGGSGGLRIADTERGGPLGCTDTWPVPGNPKASRRSPEATKMRTSKNKSEARGRFEDGFRANRGRFTRFRDPNLSIFTASIFKNPFTGKIKVDLHDSATQICIFFNIALVL